MPFLILFSLKKPSQNIRKNGKKRLYRRIIKSLITKDHNKGKLNLTTGTLKGFSLGVSIGLCVTHKQTQLKLRKEEKAGSFFFSFFFCKGSPRAEVSPF